jgi:uncharacterized protein (TIGR03000 family)
LRPGGSYSYEVRAELVRDGRTISETRRVEVAAGGTAAISIALTGGPTSPPENPVTTVVVHVPADAQVYLEGREAAGAGTVRRFSTSQVPAGGVWKDYSVRAAIRRNGRLIELEQSLSLASGQSREVKFDFDAQRVAEVATVAR